VAKQDGSVFVEPVTPGQAALTTSNEGPTDSHLKKKISFFPSPIFNRYKDDCLNPVERRKAFNHLTNFTTTEITMKNKKKVPSAFINVGMMHCKHSQPRPHRFS
jgi:hypothetical protein